MKQMLNQQILYMHLSLAHTWGNTWHHIYEIVEENLSRNFKAKYTTLNEKLNHLEKTQTTMPRRPQTFHPRLINNTDITFSKSETNLLQKGFKYNLHSKPRKWIQNLALEAETAITQLPPYERDVYKKQVADRISKPQQHNSHEKPHPEAKLIKSIRTKL
jgi:hypothetical protein